MANEPNHSVRVLAALEGIQKEMAEMRELLQNFTSDGWPIRSQLPSAELMASLASSMAFLLREKPISDEEIQRRLAAAQQLARLMIQMYDRFNSETQRQQLNNLVP